MNNSSHPGFEPGRLFNAALLVGILMLAPWLVAKRPNLGSRPEYRIPISQVTITPAEGYVPRNLLDQIVAQSNLPAELELLDGELTQKIAHAFARHPWIEKVERVRKSYPASIAVDVVYREPVGVVQLSTGAFPVDRKGILLPGKDFSPEALQQFPVILRVAEPPSVAPGRQWKDPTVVGAAQIAFELKGQWKEWGIRGIAVPKRIGSQVDLDTTGYELETMGGSRICWGRAPSSRAPGELTVAQKLGRLEKCRRDFGGFDGPHGPLEVDIRHWDEISRRRLQVADRPSSFGKTDRTIR